MINKNCKTNILMDHPVTEDAFSHSRQRMAEAILNMIEIDEGGKTIGIEGKWGSGKSSILNLLRICDEENCHYWFAYDAWSHEGNVLRRTFIDEFINYFIKNSKDRKLLSKVKDWERKRNEKFKKYTKQTSATNPEITKKEGFLFLFVTILFTSGLTLITKGLNNITFSSVQTRFNWEILIGIFLFGLIYFLPKIYNLFAEIFKLEKISEENSILKIVANQFRSTTIGVAESSPEINSITFQELFRIFLEDFNNFSDDGNRKLIIIIDNLDRLIKTKALTVFSTIQTFFEISNNNNLFRNVWVIIPYDRKGLEKIWETENESSIDQENENNLANHMIEKRMSIIFHVPPIVLSDFHGYFLKQLREAFPITKNHNDDELERAYQIFTYFPNLQTIWSRINHNKFKNDYKTPRQIKHLINQIGEIHRQWEYPISDILFFVLTQRFELIKSDNEIVNFLRNCKADSYLGSLLTEKFESVVITSWYNLDLDLAYQVLLGNIINLGIEGKDIEKISELEAEYPDYFWTTFAFLPIQTWQPKMLINSLLCLEDIYKTSNFETEEQRTIIEKIKGGFLEIKNFQGLFDNEDTFQALIYLVSINQKPEIVEKIFLLIQDSKLSIDNLDLTEENRNRLYLLILNRIKNISKFLIEYRDIDKSFSEIKIENLYFVNSTAIEVEFLAAVMKNNYQNFYNLTNIVISNNFDVDKEIGNLINENIFQDRHLSAMKFYLNTKFSNWGETNRQLHARISKPDNQKYLGEMLEALRLLKNFGDQHATNSLREISNNWLLLSHIEKIVDEGPKDSRSIAWCIFIQNEEKFISRGLTIREVTTARQLVKFRKILDSPDDYRETIKILVKIYHEYGDFNNFLNKYRDYQNFIDYVLMIYCEDFPEGISQLISYGFKKELSPVYSFLLKENLLVKKQEAQRFLKSGLLSLQKNDYEAAFKAKDGIFKMLLDFSDSRYVEYLGAELHEALLEIAINVMEGEKSPFNTEEYEKILKLIKMPDNVFLQKRIFHKLKLRVEENANNIHPDFYDVFAEKIPSDILFEEPGLVSNVFLELLFNDHDECITWIAFLLENDDNFVSKFIARHPTAQKDFMRLKQEVEEKINEDMKNKYIVSLNLISNQLEKYFDN